jgi:hypothetical protein
MMQALVISKNDGHYVLTTATGQMRVFDKLDDAFPVIKENLDREPRKEWWPNEQPQITVDEIEELVGGK